MKSILATVLVLSASSALPAESVDVTVRRAPYVVSTVSSKSEIARAKCRYCERTTNYNRTYRWDVYNHVWVETTKPEDVPDVCRHCRPKIRDQEKLDRRERDLDRQIEYERTKMRIDRKKAKLESLRREAR